MAGEEGTTAALAALRDATLADDHDAALRAANQVLAVDSSDPDAVESKVVALLHLGSYDDALKVLSTAGDDVDGRNFYRAYALYALFRVDECLAVLEEAETLDIREKHLYAQALFRNGRLTEAAALLTELEAVDKDTNRDELLTNVSASLIAAGKNEEAIAKCDQGGTYELNVNAGGALAALGRFPAAIQRLESARESARNALDAEGLEHDEIEEELDPILAQIAYAKQCDGDEDEARELYSAILKRSPELAVQLVCGNNLMALNRKKDMFDSLKKTKALLTETARQKLLPQQWSDMALNRAILLFFMDRIDECKEAMEDIKEQTESVALVRAAIALKMNDVQSAVRAIEDQLALSPSASLTLALARVYYQSGAFSDAVKALRTPDLRGIPAVAAARVSILVHGGSDEELDTEVKESLSNVPKEAARPLALAFAEVLSSRGLHSSAAHLCKRIWEEDSYDHEALALAVVEAARAGDHEVARTLSESLPELETGSASVDIQALVRDAMPNARQARRRDTTTGGAPQQDAAPSAPAPAATTEPAAPADSAPPGDENLAFSKDILEKIRARRREKRLKRKKRYPKGFDPSDPNNPPPDPERWLPKHERSAFRGRRRKNQLRGAQGSQSTDTSYIEEQKAAMEAEAANVAQSTRQSAQARAIQAKKRKKRR